MTTSRLPVNPRALSALCAALLLSGCAAAWGPPRELMLLAGSGPQLYSCPGGQQFSVAATREADGSIEVRFYLEPGHQLAARVGPYRVELLLPTRRDLTRGQLEALYPAPCDYLDELARPAA